MAHCKQNSVILLSLLILISGCKSIKSNSGVISQSQSDWLTNEMPVVKNETDEAKMYGDQADDLVRQAARSGLIKRIDVPSRTVYVDGSLWTYASSTDPATHSSVQGSLVNYILRRIKEDRFEIKIVDASSGEVLRSGNVGKRQ